MTDSVSLADHPVICKKVFYPRWYNEEPNFRVDVDGVSLGCYIQHGNSEAGWVLYFHGNGELAAEYAHGYGDWFAEMGVNVCFVEYRGYGASTGRPMLAAMLGDGARVLSALNVPPTRVVAFGRSLGSLYAIELAQRFPLAGLVLESGLASLADHWSWTAEAEKIGRSAEEIAAVLHCHFDHQSKLAGYKGSLLVLHTHEDRLVPVANAQRLHAWGGGEKKRLVMFPEGGHNSIRQVNEEEYTTAVRRFLQETGVLG